MPFLQARQGKSGVQFVYEGWTFSAVFRFVFAIKMIFFAFTL